MIMLKCFYKFWWYVVATLLKDASTFRVEHQYLVSGSNGADVQVKTPNPKELPYELYSGSLPLVSHPQYQHPPKLS